MDLQQAAATTVASRFCNHSGYELHRDLNTVMNYKLGLADIMHLPRNKVKIILPIYS